MSRIPLRVLSTALVVAFTVSVVRPIPASAADPVQAALEAAIAAYERGDLAGAMRPLKKVVKLKKTEARAHYYLARIYWESPERDEDKAREHYGLAKKHGIEFGNVITPIPELETPSPQPEKPRDSMAEVIERIEADIERSPNEPEVEESIPDPTLSQPDIVVAPPPEPTPEPLPVSEPEVADGIEGLPNIRDSKIGKILERRDLIGEKNLSYSDRLNLMVFESGTQMCLRLIERREFDLARQYAEDVIFVAPDFWYGYYLMTSLYLAQDDMVNAKVWWELTLLHGYEPTPGFPPLKVLPPEEQLAKLLNDADELMSERRWPEADAMLMRTQDIQDLAMTADVVERLGRADIMMGEISLELQDFEWAIESLEFAESTPEVKRLIARAQAGKDSLESIPFVRSWIPVRPMKYRGISGAPGVVGLVLGRDYLETQATGELGGGRSERVAVTAADGQYLVEGGRAYRVEFDVRRQLRGAVTYGITVATLLSLLLVM